MASAVQEGVKTLCAAVPGIEIAPLGAGVEVKPDNICDQVGKVDGILSGAFLWAERREMMFYTKIDQGIIGMFLCLKSMLGLVFQFHGIREIGEVPLLETDPNEIYPLVLLSIQ